MLAILLSANAISALESIKIESLTGSYVATDSSCHYKFAKIQITEHTDFKRSLLVETTGDKESGAHVFHHFNIDELGKTVRKNKNAENLKIRQILTHNKLSSETMGCLSNWLFCGPWNVDMIVKRLSDQSIQISQSKNDEGCTYSKVSPRY